LDGAGCVPTDQRARSLGRNFLRVEFWSVEWPADDAIMPTEDSAYNPAIVLSRLSEQFVHVAI
jgi:hypothetical protein